MMAKLYILCGPSGSGKSTWANSDERQDVAYVSRDDIRLSLLKDEENYFSHEKEVFKQFVKEIAIRIMAGRDCIADATHLNMFSRCKLIQALDMYTNDYEIVYVVFNTDAETCIERNKAREGRRNVPENIIRNMHRDFRPPTMDEDRRIKEIIEV
jgi:predicted kinase